MNPADPTRPDDDDDDDVLGPDADADARERARARDFADLIDKVMAGRTPAAVPAEAQALLEVATAIRATVRPVALAASRQRSIIESALATAIDRRGHGAGVSATSLPVTGGAVRSIGSAPVRRRSARALPWIVATVASLVAAAAIALLIVDRRPAPVRQVSAAAPVAVTLPFEQRSRAADPLVGAIARDRAGDALGRIDAIYADRLTGFRDRTLAAAAPTSGGSP